ncbi:MAG TPA: glycosyltransferase [Gemmatimonadales bacterium]|jgi:glycosyltransferase involved in cell wall biosynthesis
MTAKGALVHESDIATLTARRPTERMISVVVPVVERVDDLTAIYSGFAGELERRGEEFEFLFVFDGGFEPSPELVALSAGSERIHLHRFAQRFGETAALRLGIQRSQGDLLVTLPAYFQVTAEGIGPLIDALEGGAEMVVANRSPRLDSWLNRLQSRAFHHIIGGLGDTRFHDMACGVRVMRRHVAESIPLYGDMHRFIPALAIREGYNVVEVAVPQHPNDARTRVYGPGVYFRRMLDIATFFFLAKFTEKPLRFFGMVGSVSLVIGAVICLVLAADKIAGQAIANRPLLLLGVLLVSLGVQLMGLGLVGEIIVHLRAPHRRAYRVREQV